MPTATSPRGSRRDRRPEQGWRQNGVTVDLAFPGSVVQVDQLTGKPLAAPVAATAVPTGLRLTGLRVPFLPKGYASRAAEKIEAPAYRVTPTRQRDMTPKLGNCGVCRSLAG